MDSLGKMDTKNSNLCIAEIVEEEPQDLHVQVLPELEESDHKYVLLTEYSAAKTEKSDIMTEEQLVQLIDQLGSMCSSGEPVATHQGVSPQPCPLALQENRDFVAAKLVTYWRFQPPLKSFPSLTHPSLDLAPLGVLVAVITNRRNNRHESSRNLPSVPSATK